MVEKEIQWLYLQVTWLPQDRKTCTLYEPNNTSDPYLVGLTSKSSSYNRHPAIFFVRLALYLSENIQGNLPLCTATKQGWEKSWYDENYPNVGDV